MENQRIERSLERIRDAASGIRNAIGHEKALLLRGHMLIDAAEQELQGASRDKRGITRTELERIGRFFSAARDAYVRITASPRAAKDTRDQLDLALGEMEGLGFQEG